MAAIAGIQDFRQDGPPGDIGVFQGAASVIVYPFTFSGVVYYVAQRMGVQGWSLVSQGTVADTVIQAAITAGAGGRIVLKGIFIKTTITGFTVPSDTIVEIDGIIRLMPDVGNTPYIFNVNGVDGIKILGGTVDGNRPNHTTITGNAYNIAFFNVTNSEIAGVKSINSGTTANDGYGIYINGGGYNTISNCWDINSDYSSYTIYNNAVYNKIENCFSINAGGHAFNIHTVSHVIITGNIVDSTGLYGVTITGTTDDVLIQGNTISTVNSAIRASDTASITNLNIVGNMLYECTYGGGTAAITFSAGRVVSGLILSDNHIYYSYIAIQSDVPNAIISNNRIFTSTLGIVITGNNNIITGNHIQTTTTSSGKGIHVNGVSGSQIKNNVLQDCRQYGVYIQGCARTAVEINKFIKGASASTAIYNDVGSTDTIIRNNDLVDGAVTTLINNLGTVEVISGNLGYIASGEPRFASGSLTAGIANAICFAWHTPEEQDILIKKVVVEVTTGGGTVGSHLDVGIADDAAGTNLGTEFFNDLLLNNVQINDSWVGGDGGTQTKWVFCQDSVSVTDGWVVGQILDANAASLVGKYYIEYVGR